MPRFLKDRMRELLAEHPRPERYRSELPNEYDAALQDVIDGLEPLHLALLFEKPVIGDDEIDSMMYLILPEVYLEIQEVLRKALLEAGYGPGRTSPLIDAVLEALLGRLPVRADAVGAARLDANHLSDLLLKIAELEVSSEYLRGAAPTQAITIARVVELTE